MVGAAGVEPAIFGLKVRCLNQLGHTPWGERGGVSSLSSRTSRHTSTVGRFTALTFELRIRSTRRRFVALIPTYLLQNRVSTHWWRPAFGSLLHLSYTSKFGA